MSKKGFKKGDLVECSNNHTRVPKTDLVMVLGYQGKAIKTWRFDPERDAPYVADKEMGRLWTVIEPNGKKGVVWEDQLRKV